MKLLSNVYKISLLTAISINYIPSSIGSSRQIEDELKNQLHTFGILNPVVSKVPQETLLERLQKNTMKRSDINSDFLKYTQHIVATEKVTGNYLSHRYELEHLKTVNSDEGVLKAIGHKGVQGYYKDLEANHHEIKKKYEQSESELIKLRGKMNELEDLYKTFLDSLHNINLEQIAQLPEEEKKNIGLVLLEAVIKKVTQVKSLLPLIPLESGVSKDGNTDNPNSPSTPG